MEAIKYKEAAVTALRAGAERRVGHTEHLMMTVMDFNDGPKPNPDPFHNHPHEQITYVAAGEIEFIMEDSTIRLEAGDMVQVPSGKPHAIRQLTAHVRLVDCFTPIREDFLIQKI